MDLCNPKEIKALLGRHGFRFSKQMGQNFLIQPWVPRQTAEASGAGPGIGVLEIGPGIGPLTAQLAQLGEKVVSVELDRTLLPILAETMADYDNVEIVPGDILKTDIPALCREKLADLRAVACANLPYNITTPVITALLQAGCFASVTVMIQKEVAQRICAQPGSREVGAVSIAVRYYCEPTVLFQVSRGSFMPAPDVDSTVIRLDIRKEPPVEVRDEAIFFRVVRASFAQRRKQLQNGLAAGFPALGKEKIGEILRACGLSPTVRGETLDIPAFARIAAAIGRA